jgi:hypothetical protein
VQTRDRVTEPVLSAGRDEAAETVVVLEALLDALDEPGSVHPGLAALVQDSARALLTAGTAPVARSRLAADHPRSLTAHVARPVSALDLEVDCADRDRAQLLLMRTAGVLD